MPTKTIRWIRHYHEDLGPLSKEGTRPLALFYYIYEIYLPQGEFIRLRLYVDSSQRCQVFAPLQTWAKSSEKQGAWEAASAFLQFLQTQAQVGEIYVFEADFCLLEFPLASVDLSAYHFEEELVRQ